MPSSRGRILVVEDELLIRVDMVAALEDAGFEVLAAANGEQAIGLLSFSYRVDLVVTDIAMPIMDGIAVAERVLLAHPGVPIIFASARIDRKALPQPSHSLEKPYSSSQLVKLVDAVLAP